MISDDESDSWSEVGDEDFVVTGSSDEEVAEEKVENEEKHQQQTTQENESLQAAVEDPQSTSNDSGPTNITTDTSGEHLNRASAESVKEEVSSSLTLDENKDSEKSKTVAYPGDTNNAVTRSESGGGDGEVVFVGDVISVGASYSVAAEQEDQKAEKEEKQTKQEMEKLRTINTSQPPQEHLAATEQVEGTSEELKHSSYTSDKPVKSNKETSVAPSAQSSNMEVDFARLADEEMSSVFTLDKGQEEEETGMEEDQELQEIEKILHEAPSRPIESIRVKSSVRRWDFKKMFSVLEDSLKHSNVQEICRNNTSKGSTFDDSTILVFLGLSGAGKTTTLLHLAGVQFEEHDLLAGIHLEPTAFPETNLQAFATACGAESVTDRVQAHAIQYEDQKVILLDGPGLDDTRSREEQVAHTIAFLEVLQQTNGKVLPVFVLAVDSFGSRFTGLVEALEQVSRMTLLEDDFESFRYVFTKTQDCPNKWRNKIPQILDHVRERRVQNEENNPRLAALLDDMIAKISKKGPILIEPMEKTGNETLSTLMHDYHEHISSSASASSQSSFRLVDTGLFFKTSLSESTSNSLRVEFQYLVQEIDDCLCVEREADPLRCYDFSLAEKNLRTLLRLREVLPQEIIIPSLEEAKLKVNRLVAHCRSKLEEELSRLDDGGTLSREDPKFAQATLKGMQRHLIRLSRLDEVLSPCCKLPESDRVMSIVDSVWMPFWHRVVDRVSTSLAALINQECKEGGDSNFVQIVANNHGLLRWNMACFHALTVAAKHSFEEQTDSSSSDCNRNGYVQRAYVESWNQLQMVIELYLGTVEEMMKNTLLSPSSAYDIKLVNALVGLLVDIHDDVENGYYSELNEDASNNEWKNNISERLRKFTTRLECVTRDHFDKLSDICDLMQNILKRRANWTSPSDFLVDLNAVTLGASREYLLALVQSAPKLVELLPDHLGSKDASNVMSSFDNVLFDYLVELTSFAQIRLPDSSHYLNPKAVITDGLRTNDALRDAIALCDSIARWTDFDGIAVVELKQVMKERLKKRVRVQIAMGVVAGVVLIIPK